MADGFERMHLTGHDGPVHDVAWSTDGRIATGSEDLTAKVWLAATGARLSDVPGSEGWNSVVAWTRGNELLTASRAPEITAWTGEVSSRMARAPGHEDAFEPLLEMEVPIVGVALGADGVPVALDASGRVAAWGGDVPSEPMVDRGRWIRSAPGGLLLVDAAGVISFHEPGGAVRWAKPSGR